MSWFDEQIRQRRKNDDEVFTDSFVSIAGAVMGKKVYNALNDKLIAAKNAVEEILKYYHIKSAETDDKITDINDRIEYMMRPHGIMHRTVKLSKGWYKDAWGPMLGVRRSDGTAAAFIPAGFTGYFFIDENGRKVKISAKNEDEFEDEALAFYKPLPLRKLGIADLFGFMFGALSASDITLLSGSVLLITLVGMLTPRINSIIFSDVINSGSMRLLRAISIFLVCVTLSSLILTSVKTLLTTSCSTKLSLTVESAVMMRVLSLPADFFKKYSAGDLTQRVQYVRALCNMLTNQFFGSVLTSLFSLIYIFQIFRYAPALVVPALTVILAELIVILISTYIEMKINRLKTEHSAKESGMTFALISGVRKIKLSGAEKRAFARWGRHYAEEASLEYDPPMLIKINTVITTAITLAGTIAMYYMAVRSGVSVADFYAFNSAYGMVSGSFTVLSASAVLMAQIMPMLEMLKPILETEPEISSGKEPVSGISGGIELNNVSFGYNENMPLIVDNMSLKIRPGQYVAIVGRTGCGKSTLIRLLLGFEKPQKGAVYYDGRDINKLDLRSLRRKIGIVMQNGKLFQGDIFSNIVISSPQLTLDDAWEAAELAGMADDIKRMPMGMNTVISEGGGGISGGQRQRLLIARAIAPKPKLLIFDEATSALDNITQKKVSESLDKLKCTRIVIAHRLSTIKQCDRIIVLDKGKITEEGTYEELIARNGFFAELVERQRIDNND